MKRIQNTLVASIIGLTLGFASQANAGITHSVADAAPVIGEGEYSGRLVADILLNNGGGLNITPRIKTGLLDQYVDITGVIGAGKTDWQVGAIAKYNLLPDIAGQVALSFLGSAHLLKTTSTSLQLGFGSVVSKKMQASFGEVTPYGSLEVDFLIRKKGSFIPVHLNAGAIWAPMSTGPWAFISELQLSLARGDFAIALGTSYRF